MSPRTDRVAGGGHASSVPRQPRRTPADADRPPDGATAAAAAAWGGGGSSKRALEESGGEPLSTSSGLRRRASAADWFGGSAGGGVSAASVDAERSRQLHQRYFRSPSGPVVVSTTSAAVGGDDSMGVERTQQLQQRYYRSPSPSGTVAAGTASAAAGGGDVNMIPPVESRTGPCAGGALLKRRTPGASPFAVSPVQSGVGPDGATLSGGGVPHGGPHESAVGSGTPSARKRIRRAGTGPTTTPLVASEMEGRVAPVVALVCDGCGRPNHARETCHRCWACADSPSIRVCARPDSKCVDRAAAAMRLHEQERVARETKGASASARLVTGGLS